VKGQITLSPSELLRSSKRFLHRRRAVALQTSEMERELELQIDDIAFGGTGVGRVEGKACQRE
jgi:hypothetical protein